MLTPKRTIGDGRDDYIWLSEKGEAKIYINYVEDIPENWKGLNDGKYVALGVGARREDVRLADLDVSISRAPFYPFQNVL